MGNFHISKRKTLAWYTAWAIRGCAILLALLVCAVVTTALTGEDPIAVYKTMFSGAFGTPRKLWTLGQNIAILLCVSLAVTPAFKMRFWNVGGEGQILIGGLATAACMILLGDKLPNWLLILIMLLCACGAGALWGMIPAVIGGFCGSYYSKFGRMLLKPGIDDYQREKILSVTRVLTIMWTVISAIFFALGYGLTKVAY